MASFNLLAADLKTSVASSTGGNFRYVNRGNDQGGLTFVTNGVPTYVDWLIFNAVSNALSINNPNGDGINDHQRRRRRSPAI